MFLQKVNVPGVVLFTHLYYEFKPFLPWGLRTRVRRWFTRNKLERFHDVWPIYPVAGRTPEGWPGWPDGKRFALVLTHDVETKLGLAKCNDLMEMESRLGFRSSFNFVPELYQTPKELRDKLASRGFEVGVHGLKHDGKLYRSRRIFSERAQQINAYLKEWNVTGFRSPFMHHNLDWLHELNVRYDMSTFDTDPFEPQSDGVHTIFPFWVPGPAGRPGYAEMPYTLPQDSTLFLLLEEPDITIWKQKLDWIAQHGGMALINTHPDYMNFGDGAQRTAYPARFYQEFLEYVRTTYAGQYWSALPREVSDFCWKHKPQRKTPSQKRVSMVSYSFYESDNRVMRYAEALVQRGDRVDIIALKRTPQTPTHEIINGVNVHRVQARQQNEKDKSAYLLRLVRFLFRSSLSLTRKQLSEKYDLIHVHNMPDFLVFAAWLPKLMGAKIILDIHDILPEFFASKFRGTHDSPYFKMLLAEEKLSAAFVHHVIISNHLWDEKIVKRSIPRERCSVFINNVDSTIFYPRERQRRDGKFRLVFPGGLQWHQGLDIAIRAFDIVRKEIPEMEFHIYGEGSAKSELLELIKELNLENQVKIFGSVPLRKVPEVVAEADLGVVPKRADSFGNEAYSTKIMEIMSQGIPMIVSKTKIDSFYFNDRVVRFFESGNVEELAKAILTVYRDKELRENLVRNGLQYAKANSWDVKKEDYLQLVDGLLNGKKNKRRILF